MTDEEGKARQGASRAGGSEGSQSWAETWARREPRRVRVDTSQAFEVACSKCHRSNKPVYRHHKGFDSLLGIYNKSIGYNYHKYLDCATLCEDCHCEIHFIYERYIENWINRTAHGARHFRAVLIGVCDDWLAGRIKSPSVPKAYRRNFHRTLLQWKKRHK